MKRYVCNRNWNDAERVYADVVIVGCGAAGLYTALNLDPSVQCVMLNKAGSQRCNSVYAQGGIATVIEPNIQDDLKRHFEDTIIAGAGLCDKDAVKVLVDEAWLNIERLIKDNVPFDMHDGDLLLTREGGHSRNRILHCGGDATGLHLTNRLYELVLARENIDIHNNMFLIDIVTNEDRATAGALALSENGKPFYFISSKVVIASGGIGRVFQNSTNATCATGDGIAAAERAGAELKDMEFVQFHPTAFVHPDDQGRYFLISEALRGEGAILRNSRGEPFMQGAHPLADLAPRDIVARAIVMETKKNNSENVYLDITTKPRDFLMERFPTIFGECASRGIDISKDWIPVMPVQHYFMGGIKTDVDARTNIPGLYACGEAACSGVHGANRLASNSLLECIVFARRCAAHINNSQLHLPRPQRFVSGPEPSNPNADFKQYSDEIRGLMTQKCGIIRNQAELTQAYARIRRIFETLDSMVLSDITGVEAYNQSLVALSILLAAIQRKKSVGAHYRSDENTLEVDRMLNNFNLDDMILRALNEDLGNGDITTLSTVDEARRVQGNFIAKEAGIVCGLTIVSRVFALLDASIVFDCLVSDGDQVMKGDIIAKVSGPARGILSGERVALNFLQRLSGIASRTREAVEQVSGTKAAIVDTRKTTPGLRCIEKYAVRIGGGKNHRFNLSDGILIKDNHILAAGGIRQAVAQARNSAPHTLKIEVEVESFAQIEEALQSGADIIMLDNMGIGDMAKAVQMIEGKALIEASGNMGEKDLYSIAKTGVDIISIGALTHTIKAMDISLRFSGSIEQQ
ncbi:MAG: L-aspartate oxidase [Bacillota bacterium]